MFKNLVITAIFGLTLLPACAAPVSMQTVRFVAPTVSASSVEDLYEADRSSLTDVVDATKRSEASETSASLSFAKDETPVSSAFFSNHQENAVADLESSDNAGTVRDFLQGTANYQYTFRSERGDNPVRIAANMSDHLDLNAWQKKNR